MCRHETMEEGFNRIREEEEERGWGGEDRSGEMKEGLKMTEEKDRR